MEELFRVVSDDGRRRSKPFGRAQILSEYEKGKLNGSFLVKSESTGFTCDVDFFVSQSESAGQPETSVLTLPQSVPQIKSSVASPRLNDPPAPGAAPRHPFSADPGFWVLLGLFVFLFVIAMFQGRDSSFATQQLETTLPDRPDIIPVQSTQESEYALNANRDGGRHQKWLESMNSYFIARGDASRFCFHQQFDLLDWNVVVLRATKQPVVMLVSCRNDSVFEVQVHSEFEKIDITDSAATSRLITTFRNAFLASAMIISASQHVEDSQLPRLTTWLAAVSNKDVPMPQRLVALPLNYEVDMSSLTFKSCVKLHATLQPSARYPAPSSERHNDAAEQKPLSPNLAPFVKHLRQPHPGRWNGRELVKRVNASLAEIGVTSRFELTEDKRYGILMTIPDTPCVIELYYHYPDLPAKEQVLNIVNCGELRSISEDKALYAAVVHATFTIASQHHIALNEDLTSFAGWFEGWSNPVLSGKIPFKKIAYGDVYASLTNELRSMRQAISRRIDRALNFSALWIVCTRI